MPEEPIFVEPSAAGPSQKLVKNEDGTTHVIPGKAHEAREGQVSNPGVRTVQSIGQSPQCPACHRTGTLKMHMNKPAGKRIYCSSSDCNYDQARIASPNPIDPQTKVVGRQGVTGVKIVSANTRN